MSGRYVAVGSSMAAGPGIRPRVPGAPVPRRPVRRQLSAPRRRAARLRARRRDVLGATTANVLTDRQTRRAAADRRARRNRRTLVTVTIGGNDVGYMPMLLTAGLPRFVVVAGRRAHVPRSARPRRQGPRAGEAGRLAEGRRARGPAPRAAGQGAVRRLPHAAAAGRHTGAATVRRRRRPRAAHRRHPGSDSPQRRRRPPDANWCAPSDGQPRPPRVVGRSVGGGFPPAVARRGPLRCTRMRPGCAPSQTSSSRN